MAEGSDDAQELLEIRVVAADLLFKFVDAEPQNLQVGKGGDGLFSAIAMDKEGAFFELQS